MTTIPTVKTQGISLPKLGLGTNEIGGDTRPCGGRERDAGGPVGADW
jgi:hypothetical protein